MEWITELDDTLRRSNLSIQYVVHKDDERVEYEASLASLPVRLTVSKGTLYGVVVRHPVDLYVWRQPDGTPLFAPLTTQSASQVESWLDRYNNEFYNVKAYLDTRDVDSGTVVGDSLTIVDLSAELTLVKVQHLADLLDDVHELLRDASMTMTQAIAERARTLTSAD